MSINCSRCELCASAQRIYTSGSFVHMTLLLRIVSEPLCLLGLSLLTISIYRAKALHFNARILLLCMAMSMVLCNVGLFLEATYTTIISFVLPEVSRCDLQVFNPGACVRLRSIYSCGGLSLTLSACSLAIERTVATFLYKTYEKEHHKWLGILLTVMQCSFCILLLSTVETPNTLPYCSLELIDSARNKTFGEGLYCANLSALVVFLLLWNINHSRTKTLVDSQLRVLSTRYQLQENISTTKVMVPIMLIVVLLTSSSMLVVHLTVPDMSKSTVVTSSILEQIEYFAPFSEYQISLMPLLSVLMIIMLPIFNGHIKKSLLRVSRLDRFIVDRKATVQPSSQEARDLYFAKLRGQWH